MGADVVRESVSSESPTRHGTHFTVPGSVCSSVQGSSESRSTASRRRRSLSANDRSTDSCLSRSSTTSGLAPSSSPHPSASSSAGIFLRALPWTPATICSGSWPATRPSSRLRPDRPNRSVRMPPMRRPFSSRIRCSMLRRADATRRVRAYRGVSRRNSSNRGGATKLD